MNEIEYFKSLTGKYLSVSININDYQYRYNGVLLDVYDTGILLLDRKVGKVRISTRDVSILDIKDIEDVELDSNYQDMLEEVENASRR